MDLVGEGAKDDQAENEAFPGVQLLQGLCRVRARARAWATGTGSVQLPHRPASSCTRWHPAPTPSDANWGWVLMPADTCGLCELGAGLWVRFPEVGPEDTHVFKGVSLEERLLQSQGRRAESGTGISSPWALWASRASTAPQSSLWKEAKSRTF